MKLHNILERQLSRLKLSSEVFPVDQKNWQELLTRINNRYVEADQERYLIERSMEISSHELLELNQKLENAQHIAGLGYWNYDREIESINWSREIYQLFGLDIAISAPSFEEIMQMIYEPDQIQLRKLIDQAFKEEKEYEYEFQLQTPNHQKRWAYVKGQPKRIDNKVIISGIIIDITIRKLAEHELAILHQQILITARRAGMADVATSILHNVGNILNSVNVSLGLLQENINQGHYKKFFAIVAMLKENSSSLSTYLTEHPKGKLIPEYLMQSGELLEMEYSVFTKEISDLTTHLQHIKDIVAMQKNLSGISGVAQTVFLPEVIETALKMSGSTFEDTNIHFQKNYEKTPFISVDSSKVLQILVNLIQNAKEAVLDNTNIKEKQIIFSIQEPSSNSIVLTIKDNGIGIDPEDFTNIFSFGFTTKINGHGFGLHSSGLAAKELGGNLNVESAGLNQGATFILTLPLSAPEKKGELHELRN
jgi:PAS domain S-box-containing protein